MTTSFMMDTQGRRVFVDKQYAAEVKLWEFQGCLNPLRSLNKRVYELSLKGDISQAFKDILIKHIEPTVVREQLEFEEHKRLGVEFGYHNQYQLYSIHDLTMFLDALTMIGVFLQDFSAAENAAIDRYIAKVAAMERAYAEEGVMASPQEIAFCSVQTPVQPRPAHEMIAQIMGGFS